MAKLDQRVTVYTDGGADPNPGPGGWGVVLIHPATGKRKELSGGEKRTTNNRMELTAAIRALEAVEATAAVDVYTDSQYLRNGITRWLPAWIRQGWRRKTGEEVKNDDLWRTLAELVAGRRVHWHWVKGHSGKKDNERADALASREIRRIKGLDGEGHGDGGGPESTPSGEGRRGGAALRPRAGAKAGAEEAAPRVADPPGVAGTAQVFLKVTCVRGRGAWAARIRVDGEEETLRGQEAETTANRLDLVAAAEALERLPPGGAVAMHTSSDYLREGASRWLQSWQARGWRTAGGKAVKNEELWRRLDRALRRHEVRWLRPDEGRERELKALESLSPCEP